MQPTETPSQHRAPEQAGEQAMDARIRRAWKPSFGPVLRIAAYMRFALSPHAAAVRAAAQERLAYYARLPYFAGMVAAGYPLVDGRPRDALLNHLAVIGEEPRSPHDRANCWASASTSCC